MTNDIIQRVSGRDVDEEPDVAEWTERLAEAGVLGERQAEAFVRFHVTNETGDEIAEQMDTNSSNVYSLTHQANERVREANRTVSAIRDLEHTVETDARDR